MGTYRNNLSGSSAFRSLIPKPLQRVDVETSKEISVLLADADTALNNLRQTPLNDDKVADLMYKEAKSSWQLSSGKNDYPFSFMIGGETFTDDDRQEIDDIVAATRYGMEMLPELPLSTRLFLRLHYIITHSPRYERKYPGEYRNSPVWIGHVGSNLHTAQYVAPVVEDMIPAITDLENYINYNTSAHPLIQAALIHYQIEAIHPFIDANGRFGRLLNMLFLIEKEVLSLPILQLSEVLKRSAANYYKHLQNVTDTGDYDAWIKFFLKAISDAAITTQRILFNEHISRNDDI